MDGKIRHEILLIQNSSYFAKFQKIKDYMNLVGHGG